MLSDPSRVDEVNAVAREMIAQAIEDAKAEGIAEGDIEIQRSGDFRFLGQVYEVPVPLPDTDLTADEAARLNDEFPRIYERNYGEGTAWAGSPVVLLNLSIKAVHRRHKPAGRTQPAANGAGTPEAMGQRHVFLPVERRAATLRIYAEAAIAPGVAVEGPCIVDVGDTTLYVPDGSTASRDELFNFVLTV
jgi:N-methylhydantoinase A